MNFACMFICVIRFANRYACPGVYRTDIEQETNGLYSFNREAKMDPAKVKAVIDGAMEEYYKATPKTA